MSLLPSATEIICALGLADNLVGISHGCDYPPEIRLRPTLTRSRLRAGLRSEEIHEQVRESTGRGQSLYEVDAKRLAALAPDLVVTQEQCSVCGVGKSDAKHALQQVGGRSFWRSRQAGFRKSPMTFGGSGMWQAAQVGLSF